MFQICYLGLFYVIVDKLQKRNDIKIIEKVTDINAEYISLISKLQVERGRSAIYLSSGGNGDVLTTLAFAWRESDLAMKSLTIWPAVKFNEHYDFPTKKSFIEQLEQWRGAVMRVESNFQENINFYTSLTVSLLKWSYSLFGGVTLDSTWSDIVAFNTLTRALDLLGVARAIGGVHYVKCSFPSSDVASFVTVRSQMAAFLEVAEQHSGASLAAFRENLETPDQLEVTLDMKVVQLTSAHFTAACQNQSVAERSVRANVWFTNITGYMDMLIDISNLINQSIHGQVYDMAATIDREFIAFTVVIVIVVGICFLLAMW